MFPPRILATGALLFCCANAHAIILLGKDNASNLTDPGTGGGFAAVARVSNSGGSSPAGSAIHLGNGYMLTANHVANRDSVSFDGTTYYSRDTSFTPVQVADGLDLKIFKLTTVPSVGAVNLLDSPTEQIAAATQVGWGRGRNPAESIGDTSVLWGNDSTINKRWGQNVPRDALNLTYTSGSFDYDYTALRTMLGSDSGIPAGLGANEGASTTYDSGSALFQNITGTWYLIGVATVVTTNGSSTYGNDNTITGSDANFYVRISTYYDDILAIVPEPRMYAALLAVMVGTLVLTRRRPRLS